MLILGVLLLLAAVALGVAAIGGGGDTLRPARQNSAKLSSPAVIVAQTHGLVAPI